MSIDRDELIAVLKTERDRWYNDGTAHRDMFVMYADAAISYFAQQLSEPPVVETIVCGSGLTAVQENYTHDMKLRFADGCDGAYATIGAAFNWFDAAEGAGFWEAISDRIYGLSKAFRASAERQEIPEPVKVKGVLVRRDMANNRLAVVCSGGAARNVTPVEARALAAALIAQADSIEKDNTSHV